MWTVTRIELYKIFKRPRTYISFIAITAIVILVQMAFYVDGKAYVEFGMQAFKEKFEISGKILNGYFVCYVILQTLLIHVPLLIALVAGDLVAGEANMGTLRLLVSKPISRTTLLTSKFIAAVIYTFLLLIWMAFLSLVVSLFIFGSDDLMIFKSDKAILLREADVFWRYLAAFGFAAIAMITVASIAFLLSIFGENSIGPIVATMSIIIFFTILSTLDLPLFNTIKPYLFTSHMLGWKGFFNDPVNTGAISRSVMVLLIHIALFVGGGIFIFNRKDILS